MIQGPGTPADVPSAVAGTGTPAAVATWWKRHLSVHETTAPGSGSQWATPEAARRPETPWRATSSSATVGISAVTRCTLTSRQSSSA